MSETPTPETDAEAMEKLAIVRKQLVAMKELNEARRELDLVSDKLCKSESAYLKNEEIIDGLKNEIEHTETFFREKLSRAADDVNEAKRERDEARRERDEARRELDELRKKLDDSDTVMKATLSDETLKDPFATAALHKLMDEKHIWPNAWRTTLPTCELDRVNE